jgi:hypothetical protein
MAATSVLVSLASTRFASVAIDVLVVVIASSQPHVESISSAPQMAEVAALKRAATTLR